MSETKKDEMMALEVKQTNELAISYDQARAQKEIEGAIVLSKRFPRDEMTMLARIQRACKRPAFAERARYAFPRGGATITGPSVNLAREMARLWGNVRYGYEVMRDDDDSRKIRAFAWDMESNTTTFSETEFKKIIYRIPRDRDGKPLGKAQPVVPDERDMRELTNKHAAIAERNCILKLLPPDFIEDAMLQCKETLKGEGSGKSREDILKKLVKAFDEIAVTPAMIEGRYGYKIADLTEDDIDELRGIFESIKDVNSTRDEYFGAKKVEVQTGSIDIADLKPGNAPGEDYVRAQFEDAPREPGDDDPPRMSVEGLEKNLANIEPTVSKRKPSKVAKIAAQTLVTREDLGIAVNLAEYPITGDDPLKIAGILKSGNAVAWKQAAVALAKWTEEQG